MRTRSWRDTTFLNLCVDVLVGGCAEQRVDRPCHHACDARRDSWAELPLLPRGANHVGVATQGDRVLAFGGLIEQNRTPHDEAFAFDGTAWKPIRRLRGACGAMACSALGDGIHIIGGAIGSEHRRSIDWHLVDDVKAGRVDTPPRSGNGCVWFQERIFCMGGEGTKRVFGQVESCDSACNRWEQYSPMRTPRHGMGAGGAGMVLVVAADAVDAADRKALGATHDGHADGRRGREEVAQVGGPVGG